MHLDCHCHILPELDDGAWCLQESIELARKQIAWGYDRVICTPHRKKNFPNTPDTVLRACDRVRKELQWWELSLELIPSMEYRLIPETWPETLEKGWLLPWEGNHILIELPIHDGSEIGNIVPEDEIKRLRDKGYIPVLAHPERYLYLSMEDYTRYHAAGALFQRNVGALEGLYGAAVSERTRALLDAGLYTLLGTDLHNQQYARFFDSIGFHAE